MLGTGIAAPKSDPPSGERMSDGSPSERLAFPREALIRAQQLAMSYKTLPGGMVTGVGGAVLLAFGLYRGEPPKGGWQHLHTRDA